MSKILNINIDDGRVPIQINGDKDRVIYLNPSDLNMPSRYDEAAKNIDKYIQQYSEAEIKDTEKAVEAIYEADKYIKGQINYIFDADVCAVLYADASCLSISHTTGYPIFASFLNAIGPIIEDTFKQDNVKLKKVLESPNVKKYTEKYNRHPALKK